MRLYVKVDVARTTCTDDEVVVRHLHRDLRPTLGYPLRKVLEPNVEKLQTARNSCIEGT